MAIQRKTGEYIVSSTAGESVRAFVPNPLPPNPPLELTPFFPLLDRANQALGRLDGLSSLLPDTSCSYIFTSAKRPCCLPRSRERSRPSPTYCYLRTRTFQASRLATSKRSRITWPPCSMASIACGRISAIAAADSEIHEVLLRGGRGAEKTPGEFRRTLNWIGGSRPGNAAHVPPPPELLME